MNMNKTSKVLICFFFSIILIPAAHAQTAPKQVILIGVDGLQLNHFNQMLSAGSLGNFAAMTGSGGWNGSLTITGHSSTETAPGNAELHSGLTQALNGVDDNTCGVRITAGKTIFERLHSFNPDIPLGSVYGKGTCYIPDAVLG